MENAGIVQRELFPLITKREKLQNFSQIKAQGEKSYGFFQFIVSVWLSGFKG